MARLFVGIAWPYANGPFHIGHLAGAYLPGDTFARFHRLVGDEVLMVSGSDMHGTPILVRAELEGVRPQVIAERFDAVNREAFRELGFSYDLFTHTHTPIHERVTQELFLVLLQNGFLDRRSEENPYCPRHTRFLPDRYLQGRCPYCGFESARGDECDRCGRVLEPKQLGDPRCALCSTPAEFRSTEHFYLRLDKLQPELEKYLADKGYWRGNVLEATRNFLKSGLQPRPVTRDLDWGVPIPLDGYDSKRIYVWFDAVIGYLSASQEWAVRKGEPDAWKRFWSTDAPVRHYYFVGKDNIFFHTLLWPAILAGHKGFVLPYDVPANEWLQIEGRKISKSRPTDATAFLPSLLERYPPDVIRFYAAALAPQNHDTEFDWDEFHRLAEDVLSNQFGNLVQRILVFAREHFAGRVPTPGPEWSPDGPESLGRRILRAHDEIAAEFEAVHLKEALERALTEVRETNRWFQEAQPWQAAPDPMARIVYEGLWLLKAAAVWLAPVLPFSAADIWRMLGYDRAPGIGDWKEALVPPSPGQALGEIQPLFPRQESAAATAPQAPIERPVITPSDPSPSSFVPLAIRAGVVREAVAHPQADRLYILTVEIGEARARTVVAGIRPFYATEELVGRRVALLVNLEPRTIRRITSQGMVLAADSGDRVELLTPPEDVAPGEPIDGFPDRAPTISFSAFNSNPLLVGAVTGPAPSGHVSVDLGGKAVDVEGAWSSGVRVVVQLDGPEGSGARVIHFARDRLLSPGTGSAVGTRVR